MEKNRLFKRVKLKNIIFDEITKADLPLCDILGIIELLKIDIKKWYGRKDFK